MPISVDDLVHYGTGELTIRVVWLNLCEDPDREKRWPAECAGGDAWAEALGDTETTFHVAIRHLGDPALVQYPTEEEMICASGLSVPVMVRVTSDDGTLEGEFEATLGTGCEADFRVRISELSLVDIQVDLAQAAGDWGDEASVGIGLGFFDDRVWFDVYVYPGGHFFPILKGAMLHDGDAVHDISRAAVGMANTDSVPEYECIYEN